MNWSTWVRFGVARAAKRGRAGLTLLLATGLAVAAGFCGCESTEGRLGEVDKTLVDTRLAEFTTPELKTRRAEVLKRYAEIQRDVEMKSGLPMGVAIKDDRALLGELYREAHEIDRELQRRFSRGDPEVTMEMVGLKW
jgi:hypothetical protein